MHVMVREIVLRRSEHGAQARNPIGLSLRQGTRYLVRSYMGVNNDAPCSYTFRDLKTPRSKV